MRFALLQGGNPEPLEPICRHLRGRVLPRERRLRRWAPYTAAWLTSATGRDIDAAQDRSAGSAVDAPLGVPSSARIEADSLNENARTKERVFRANVMVKRDRPQCQGAPLIPEGEVDAEKLERQ